MRADPVVACVDQLLRQIPEMPIPRFMCIWRVDSNVGCGCDGYDHPVQWIDPHVLMPTTHLGPPSCLCNACRIR